MIDADTRYISISIGHLDIWVPETVGIQVYQLLTDNALSVNEWSSNSKDWINKPEVHMNSIPKKKRDDVISAMAVGETYYDFVRAD